MRSDIDWTVYLLENTQNCVSEFVQQNVYKYVQLIASRCLSAGTKFDLHFRDYPDKHFPYASIEPIEFDTIHIPTSFVANIFNYFKSIYPISEPQSNEKEASEFARKWASNGYEQNKNNLAMHQTAIAVTWTAFHEAGHLVNGHVDLISPSRATHRRRKNIKFNQTIVSKLDIRTLEYDADCFATKWILTLRPFNNFILSNKKQLEIVNPVLHGAFDDDFWLYWTFRSIYCFLAAIERIPSNPSEPLDPERTHLSIKQRRQLMGAFVNEFGHRFGFSHGENPMLLSALLDSTQIDNVFFPNETNSLGSLEGLVSEQLLHAKESETARVNWAKLYPHLKKLARSGAILQSPISE